MASFITFEGLDGSGKSTHLLRAARRLDEAGIAYRATEEPGGTGFGRAVRQLFLDSGSNEVDGVVETLLIFAGRRHHLRRVIEPALDAGRHVLCDRFTDSTRAYQGHGRGVPLEVVDEVDRLATGGRRPDRTLLFDLPPEVARRRGHSPARSEKEQGIDRLDSEDVEFYARVRNGYLEMARAEPERFRIIDSAGSHEATEAQVRRALADLFAELA